VRRREVWGVVRRRWIVLFTYVLDGFSRCLNAGVRLAEGGQSPFLTSNVWNCGLLSYYVATGTRFWHTVMEGVVGWLGWRSGAPVACASWTAAGARDGSSRYVPPRRPILTFLCISPLKHFVSVSSFIGHMLHYKMPLSRNPT
jgi:hypothetical protein